MSGVSFGSMAGGAASLLVVGGLTGAAIGASVHSGLEQDHSKGEDGFTGAGIGAVGAISAGIALGGAAIAAEGVASAVRAAGHSQVAARAAGSATFAGGAAAYIGAGLTAGFLTFNALQG